MVSRISACQTIMQRQWLLFLDMQMLGSDLELATVIEIRCHWAAGYSATVHNKAFFTELMKASYITARSTSWDTPSRLPVERYQAASTDAATWPNLDAFRNCWNAAICGIYGKLYQLIDRTRLVMNCFKATGKKEPFESIKWPKINRNGLNLNTEVLNIGLQLTIIFSID